MARSVLWRKLRTCERNDLATVVSRIFRIFGWRMINATTAELVLHGNATKPFAMAFIMVGEDFRPTEPTADQAAECGIDARTFKQKARRLKGSCGGGDVGPDAAFRNGVLEMFEGQQ
jgi:hypothetical protein